MSHHISNTSKNPVNIPHNILNSSRTTSLNAASIPPIDGLEKTIRKVATQITEDWENQHKDLLAQIKLIFRFFQSQSHFHFIKNQFLIPNETHDTGCDNCCCTFDDMSPPPYEGSYEKYNQTV